ncbi:MAG TPA: Wzz/FepE/Etk N-terminal domain-containing protein, partial [Ignavibacteriaceae bacterium]|nr:Wzz/FepE/Etk N-terminal domain-containing protein [Ignavibacteriaceae bacterium]
MDSTNQTKKSLSDYLYLLLKWKRFLIINLLIVVLISTTVAFLIPVKYKSTATIMIPQDGGFGLGGLTSLIGGGKNPAASLGSKIFGVMGSSEDVFMGILNSRTSIVHVIEKFDLIDYYEISDSNIDKTIKAFVNDLDFSVNEFGMIDISVINEDATRSAEIANYFVILLDSLNIKL